MKTKLIFQFIFLLLMGTYSLNAKPCELEVKNLTPQLYKGNLCIVEDINYLSMSRYLELYINETQVFWVYENERRLIKIHIPQNLEKGKYTLKIWDILNENCAEAEFEYLGKKELKTDSINPYDPDPNTNLGAEVDYSKKKTPKTSKGTVKNKSGGSTSKTRVDCDKFHIIDGVFTDSVGYGTTKEWSTIDPLIGTFSNLYLDYCSKSKILHIMNDWKLGNGNYDTTTCYNEFEFSTAGGAENWKIKIWNSVTKGIVVTLNGKDVSKDTNFVINGRYGFDKSLLVDSNHTMWEFGVKASGGLFVMRIFKDEVAVTEYKPTVQLVCDDNGYGTISEPHIISGILGDEDSEITISERYIPLSGVAGLVTETHTFGGSFSKDTATIYSSKNNKKIVNICKENHKIDGKFTNETGFVDEWKTSEPAIGMFSNLYAEFCKGRLYILNDWKLGYEEPDKKNCYNLFELFTGSGKEHWGIHVFNDPEKKPIVFLNGKDVSNDTNYVEDGKYGFDKSPLEDYEHTIYEFSIKAQEGGWQLFLCDPGPSSFCDSNSELPRKMGEKIIAMDANNNNMPVSVINSYYNDTVRISYGYERYTDIYGSSFEFNFDYDKFLFYPFIDKIINDNKQYFDSMNVSQPIAGKLIISGKSKGDVFKNKSFVTISGLVLAGYDSVSTVGGSLNLGNNARYMRNYPLQNVKISSDSKCPVTKSLVRSPELSIISVIPNPIETNSTNVLIKSEYNTAISINLRDIYGNIAFNIDNYEILEGINVYDLQQTGLVPGIYFIEITDGINSSTFKVIKI